MQPRRIDGPRPRDLELAREFARRFAERCDPAAFDVILFGSRARGDADADADLDLFVDLDGVDPDHQLRAWADQVAVDLTLQHGVLFSAMVADVRL